MRISESCAKCLFDRQKKRSSDREYLSEVKKLIDERAENDTSPLMVYRFNLAFERRFGASDEYAEMKRRYNDLVLQMENPLRQRIVTSDAPLRTALAFARIGNYIDYGAMDTVDESTFLGLFDDVMIRDDEVAVYHRFVEACQTGKQFLLIADNCGEIVLDKLFLEQLALQFPKLEIQVLVRGKEVLNDVTAEDAAYVGIDQVAEIISNGDAIAGTVYDLMPDAARQALDMADVILAKGQGNYESLSGQGRHIFYSFLCKCELFTQRFHVPPLTGMLVEETV